MGYYGSDDTTKNHQYDGSYEPVVLLFGLGLTSDFTYGHMLLQYKDAGFLVFFPDLLYLLGRPQSGANLLALKITKNVNALLHIPSFLKWTRRESNPIFLSANEVH